MTRKPHEETRLAKIVERRVLELRPTKSQAETANAAGYPTARASGKAPQGERAEATSVAKGGKRAFGAGNVLSANKLGGRNSCGKPFLPKTVQTMERLKKVEICIHRRPDIGSQSTAYTKF